MKKSYIVLLTVALAMALVVPATISMAGKAAPPPPQNQNQNQNRTPTPAPKKTPSPHTVIQAITATSITIKEPKGSATYKITDLTEIDFKGEPAKVTDLKPGMSVVVTVGLDPTQADRISADDPPKKK
jgi:hypothetical protein